MKAEIAKLWVAALRSGEYMQGRGKLRNVHNEFCCLGVLCNLHAQAHSEIAARQEDVELYMGELKVLPTKVRNWAGMASCDGDYNRGYDTLASDNDMGNTFSRIAQTIETLWKNL